MKPVDILDRKGRTVGISQYESDITIEAESEQKEVIDNAFPFEIYKKALENNLFKVTGIPPEFLYRHSSYNKQ